MPQVCELQSLLADAFKGKGFQKISDALQEKGIYPQKYSKQLLNQMDKVLKKELDKNEFSNVSLLLKCIQLYCRSDPQEGVNLLLQQGLIPKMVAWFERTREFLSLIEPKESKFLAKLVEDFFDTALVIAKSNDEGKKQLLESFLLYLGHIAIEPNVTCALRQEALRTLNTLLDNVAREERKKFALSEEMCLLTKELAKMILEVGDYDIQVAILEALFRLMLKKWRDDLVHNWFEDQHVVNAFKEIKDREFETDCRKFLNVLNQRLGDKRRVFSFPCKAAYADTNQLTKPADEKLEEFWVDFNCGSESVTFYLNNPESPFWESVRLSKEDISSYCVEERGEEKILKMLLRNSTTINKKEVTKIKIHVDSKFDIASPLSKISEKVKMVILDEVETGSRRDQPEQNETVADNHAEWIKDSADTESLSDIFGSHQSNESATVTTKMSTPVDAVDKGEQTGQEHGSPGQASTDTPAVSPTHTAPILKTPPPLKLSLPKQKDKTVVHSELNAEEEVDSQPMEILTAEDDEKGRKRSSSKEMADTRKDAYEFGSLSDPVAHSMVSEMKQKVFVQKTPLHRNLEKGTVEVHKTKPSSGYKSHLFSESNQETPGNSPREKSWILNSQKESGYKTIDYTRRKPKFRSKLKVLPLSSPSSSSDHRAKKIGDSSMHREMAKKRRSTPIHSFLAQQQTGGLELADVAVSLSGASSFDDSDASKSKNCDVISGTLPLKDRVSKSKRKLTGFLSGLGEKRLKTTERKSSNEQSSSFSFEPKKLFDSVEMEEATHKGESVDLVEDHVPPMFQEDSGVIAAFESFTNELKKTFWSRYKRTEIYMRNTLKMPEQNMSALLNQIHQCRLKELEHFHKIVLKELDNLEKRSQFLSTLEKDSVDTVHGLRARWRSRECKGDRPECSV
ncbi:synaptonemal complex protein 2-like isoform X2 [Sphaerodactylus townsendi]|uniref:synaptonemal complex protein 2-like isoform X2 n=1 Tax=Sphaerodactylus townsendi TaxID=933632 RepID=UPI0020274D8D|nr:synaptonemal complex protein 2-like isoform X2 [Sphaerodactylus townsendi]